MQVQCKNNGLPSPYVRRARRDGLFAPGVPPSRYGDNLRMPEVSSLACQPKLADKPGERRLAEREGFEPPCRLPGKTLSRRPRYDHFGTSP